MRNARSFFCPKSFCQPTPQLIIERGTEERGVAIGLTFLYNTGGLAFSFQLDVPTGPFIVLIASPACGLSFLLKRLLK